MSAYNPLNPFANVDLTKFDVTKMMGELKLPGVDFNNMMESQRKNIEAVMEANKVALEGMQAIAQRQAEMLTESMSAASEAAQQLSSAKNPQEMATKQAELSKEAFEKALANMRELAEMVGKSNSETFEVMNNRFNESLQELKSVMEVKQ